MDGVGGYREGGELCFGERGVCGEVLGFQGGEASVMEGLVQSEGGAN